MAACHGLAAPAFLEVSRRSAPGAVPLGAPPLDQHMSRVDDALRCLVALAVDAVQDQAGDLLADQVSRRPDGRERRDARGAEFEIAEADHGKAAWHRDSLALALEQGAERDQ